ncbi:hypothetical protein Q7A53_09410 [Halobacillus rhizosphaerae]|uniref:surface carbohydrate biosynthesis protein n=1 Tax=Halobacillus rhizosphaerae TaxID=3064889 RepID=UPI00398AA335
MNNKKKWLYLPIEVKVRELDAKLLLSYYALREGYRVVLGEHQMVELAANTLPKGIFFSKGYTHGYRQRVITNAHAAGHKIVELDEEGFLVSDQKKYMRDRMKADMLELVSQEYCWGDYQKDIIIQKRPNRKNMCYVTGSPRLDLLKPKFQYLFKEEVNRLKGKFGTFILINTRFTSYNYMKGKKENTDAVTVYMKKLYESFLQLIHTMAVRYPDVNIVIRPHPGENSKSYQKEFTSYPKVHVLHQGNIINWLAAAKVVIHNGCTSSIEAFLLGKSTISYLPIVSKEFDVELANQLGIKASTIAEVHSILDKIIINGDFTRVSEEQYAPENRQLLDHYSPVLKETFTYNKILKLMNKLPVDAAGDSSPKQPMKVRFNAKLKYVFPSLYRKEIWAFYKKMDKLERNISHLTIEQLGDNLFKIERID